MDHAESSLLPPLDAARARLAQAQDAVARASVGGPGRSGDAAMAATAAAATFEEALLAAQHARFAELKSVAK